MLVLFSVKVAKFDLSVTISVLLAVDVVVLPTTILLWEDVVVLKAALFILIILSLVSSSPWGTLELWGSGNGQLFGCHCLSGLKNGQMVGSEVGSSLRSCSVVPVICYGMSFTLASGLP